MPTPQTAYIRHAFHFLEVFRTANRLFLQGSTASQGIHLFEQNWLNIRSAQRWASTHAARDTRLLDLTISFALDAHAILYLRQHAQDSVPILQQALALAREVGDVRLQGHALGNLGGAFTAVGDMEKATAYYEQTLNVARQLDDQATERATMGNLALVYMNSGKIEQAIVTLRHNIQLAQISGDRRVEGIATGNLGLAHSRLGDANVAIGYLKEALGIAREIDDREREMIWLGLLATAYKREGEFEKVVEYEEKALEIARETGNRSREANYLFNKSLTLEKQGNRQQAVFCAEAALNIYEEICSPNSDQVRRVVNGWKKERPIEHFDENHPVYIEGRRAFDALARIAGRKTWITSRVDVQGSQLWNALMMAKILVGICPQCRARSLFHRKTHGIVAMNRAKLCADFGSAAPTQAPQTAMPKASTIKSAFALFIFAFLSFRLRLLFERALLNLNG